MPTETARVGWIMARAQIVALLCAMLLSPQAPVAAAQTAAADAVIEAVRERVEALATDGRLSVEDAQLSATGSLATLYELHGYEPFWDDARLVKLLDALLELGR